jgi:hypothetical protein
VHEPAWPARSAQELREVCRHEALLNLALAGAQVSILCPYDTRLGGAVIACAEQTHPAVIRGPRREPSSSFIAGAIPAECDLPLNPPPADAEMLEYRDELARVRRFAASGRAWRAWRQTGWLTWSARSPNWPLTPCPIPPAWEP